VRRNTISATPGSRASPASRSSVSRWWCAQGVSRLSRTSRAGVAASSAATAAHDSPPLGRPSAHQRRHECRRVRRPVERDPGPTVAETRGDLGAAGRCPRQRALAHAGAAMDRDGQARLGGQCCQQDREILGSAQAAVGRVGLAPAAPGRRHGGGDRAGCRLRLRRCQPIDIDQHLPGYLGQRHVTVDVPFVQGLELKMVVLGQCLQPGQGQRRPQAGLGDDGDDDDTLGLAPTDRLLELDLGTVGGAQELRRDHEDDKIGLAQLLLQPGVPVLAADQLPVVEDLDPLIVLQPAEMVAQQFDDLAVGMRVGNEDPDASAAHQLAPISTVRGKPRSCGRARPINPRATAGWSIPSHRTGGITPTHGLRPWVRSALRPRAPTPCRGWVLHLHATDQQDRVRFGRTGRAWRQSSSRGPGGLPAPSGSPVVRRRTQMPVRCSCPVTSPRRRRAEARPRASTRRRRSDIDDR
jgi:hypothetical protein